ncbi:GatB/GatE catalytic domain-containing protein [Bipolaris maydis]|nr:GatB/GatE catalytic domain-containing protein [Bipolaris maydis]
MFVRSTRNSLAAASKQAYVCRPCLSLTRLLPLDGVHSLASFTTRSIQTETQSPPSSQDGTSFRKLLKDAAKQQKKEEGSSSISSKKSKNARLEKWELTVGIEVHAELNTARKLFSSAATSVSEPPNTHVSLFDVAFPGTQPHFQKETLLPALRAAIAFQCEIQPKSSFDRKHYFYQDQPSGYQITQYYEPFAKNGKVTLYPHDFPAGAAPHPEPFDIGIKQIQMEQDTAKTVQQPPSAHLLDFNRVSHPLIEIITLPEIHDPMVAAVVVRKIQNILKAVNSCTTGMELGGLRADVNVSVRQRHVDSSEPNHSYSGITGLGQRTEIKNLASVKAVEDAIIAERDRQIDLLESGGTVEGETRGWTLGSKTTKRLRGKEGEIDYRYMPDPDIAPVIIGEDLVEHLKNTLPKLPDVNVDVLVHNYGLTTKDAITLLSFDDGERLEYYMDVITESVRLAKEQQDSASLKTLGKIAGNWVLMELGSLFKDEPWDPSHVSARDLAEVISFVRRKEVTSPSAKRLLAIKFEGDARSVQDIVHQENLLLQPLSQEEYINLAKALLEENPKMVRDITEKGQVKKTMWFVGQMVARAPDGGVEPGKAKIVLQELLGLDGKA